MSARLAKLAGATLLSLPLLIPAPLPSMVLAGGTGNAALPAVCRSWTHVKSAVAYNTDDAFYGYRNVYVNAAGEDALRGGGDYPDGSVLVMSFHVPVKNADTYVQGKPMKTVIMQKDHKGFAATGGWGYEAYKAGDTAPLVGDKAVEKSHACHAAQAGGRDFVFSSYVK